MRIAVIILAIASSSDVATDSVFDEFAAGFGGVPWGMDISALVAQFPGGYEEFSTAPGRVSYALNIDDPVLGIARRGEYVLYDIGLDGKVDEIDVQVPYDQATLLISTIKSRFGPEKGIEIKGIVTTHRWPTEQGFGLAVRTTNNRAYGLTTLSIVKLRPISTLRPSGGKPG